eukprot:sb/3467496/
MLEEKPTGVQFDHWHDPSGSSVQPIRKTYKQASDWESFSACLSFQTSYTGNQAIFSYNGMISLFVTNGYLSAQFQFSSSIPPTVFTNTTVVVNDARYHSGYYGMVTIMNYNVKNLDSSLKPSHNFRVCLSWASSGGALSIRLDSSAKEYDLISSDMKTWPLSDQKLGAGDVTLFLGSDGTGGNTFHGFVKDMSVLQKFLSGEDLENYFDSCMYPAANSTRVFWKNILDLAGDHETMEYNDGACSDLEYNPVCDVSKQPIRTRYLGHVTSYQPIREFSRDWLVFPDSVGSDEQYTL